MEKTDLTEESVSKNKLEQLSKLEHLADIVKNIYDDKVFENSIPIIYKGMGKGKGKGRGRANKKGGNMNLSKMAKQAKELDSMMNLFIPWNLREIPNFKPF